MKKTITAKKAEVNTQRETSKPNAKGINANVRSVASKSKQKKGTVKIQGEEYIEVQSSNLKAYRYDESKKELTVVFNNRRRYLFAGVPKVTVTGLAGSMSKGVFFNSRIRYKFTNREIF